MTVSCSQGAQRELVLLLAPLRWLSVWELCRISVSPSPTFPTTLYESSMPGGVSICSAPVLQAGYHQKRQVGKYSQSHFRPRPGFRQGPGEDSSGKTKNFVLSNFPDQFETLPPGNYEAYVDFWRDPYQIMARHTNHRWRSSPLLTKRAEPTPCSGGINFSPAPLMITGSTGALVFRLETGNGSRGRTGS